MKSFFIPLIRVFLASAIVVSLTSCDDDALVAQNQKLRQQLSQLEKEVDLLKINAGEDPGDQSTAIKKSNADLAKALAKLEQLDDERERLETSHAAREKEFRDYQKKYQIR
jgi:cell division protein FtsB